MINESRYSLMVRILLIFVCLISSLTLNLPQWQNSLKICPLLLHPSHPSKSATADILQHKECCPKLVTIGTFGIYCITVYLHMITWLHEEENKKHISNRLLGFYLTWSPPLATSRSSYKPCCKYQHLIALYTAWDYQWIARPWFNALVELY